MSKKMRVVAWLVQPIIMADDGEDLTEQPVQAVKIPARDWDNFKSGGDEAALAELRTKIEES